MGFFCWFAGIGILFVFGASAQAQQNRRVRAGIASLFGSKNFLNSGIINGPVALSDGGSIQQIGNVTAVRQEAISLHFQLHAVMDVVEREPDSPQKAELLEEMDTLANQVLKPAEWRDHSKIACALQRITHVFSVLATTAKLAGGVASAWDAWQRIMPAIKSHLGL